LKTADVSDARLGKEWAQAVADAEAEASEEADGLAELAMVVGVIACVTENDTMPVGMTDALKDAVVDILEITAKLLEDDAGALLCVLLEAIVAIVDESVIYGGRCKSGVAVGQSFVHGLTSFAPRTWSAYIGGIVIPSLM
jgi:hypothetical protein